MNEKNFCFSKIVKDNTEIRKSFNELTRRVYEFDFEQWYKEGFWSDAYCPYVLLENQKVIANVSVNQMDFMVMGKKKRYIQIGTVMTDSAYRKKGLSRYLMDMVLAEWKDQCDGIYLFANDTVLDFYPKFGFERIREYQYKYEISSQSAGVLVEKLNMKKESHKKLLLECYKYSNPYSAFSMEDNPGLLMFYCNSFMSDAIYYIREWDAVVIAEFEGDEMICYDIFAKQIRSAAELCACVSRAGTKKILYGFTPKDSTGCMLCPLQEEDSALFVLKGKEDIDVDKKFMFPLLSHA